MKFRKEDKVKILKGKDIGKEGTVLKVIKEENKILVEGVNIVKKHVKPGAVSKEGGIIKMEKPINASNAMVICNKCNKPTRVGFKLEKDKKFRVCKKCSETLDK